jgi:hypothetical protein
MSTVAYPEPFAIGEAGLRTPGQLFHWLGVALNELSTLPVNEPRRAERAIYLARGLVLLLEEQQQPRRA